MKIIKSTIPSDPVIVLQIRDGEKTGFVIDNLRYSLHYSIGKICLNALKFQP